MSLEEDIQLLRNVSLFGDFDDEHLRLIAFGSQKMTFSKDHELYRQGQSTTCGFVIVSGRVELVSHHKGIAKTVGIYGPGSLLGEIALISRNERLATAIVRTDCEVMKITRTVMHRILNEYPELAVLLHNKISQSVSQFTEKLKTVRL